MANQPTQPLPNGVMPPMPVAPGAPVAQAPVRAVDAHWTCTVNKPGPAGVAMAPVDHALTVGEIFVLVCEGDSANLNASKAFLEMPKTEKYALKILKTQSLEATKGIFTATSYKVAQAPVKGAVLTDGVLRVGLEGINLNLESVITQQENPEHKPYSPLEPYHLAWPMWIWFVLAAVLAVIALAVLNVLQATAQKRRLQQELSRHGSALSPYQHLNKELRGFNRSYPLSASGTWTQDQASTFIRDLDQAFRWFLTREFVVPAHEWRSGRALNEIRRKNKILFKTIGKDLKTTLRELDRARSVGASLTTLDASQLVDLCRKSADLIHNGKKGSAA